MKKSLEKTIGVLTLASALAVGGCDSTLLEIPFLNKSKDSSVKYAERQATKMREGYNIAKNVKINFENYDNLAKDLSKKDSIYKELIYIDDINVLKDFLSRFNGFYKPLRDNGDAIIFKNGYMGSFKNLKDDPERDVTAEFVPPAVFLDDNRILVGYKSMVYPNPNGPFAKIKPYEIYDNFILDSRIEDCIYRDYAVIFDADYNITEDDYDIFERLRDNSKMTIRTFNNRYNNIKTNILKNNPELYKKHSSLIK